jgi:hypothetical protein
MGVLTWIRKMQQALHQCAESIRNREGRQTQQHLPPDKPVEVRAVVSYDAVTVANTSAQNDRQHTTQDSIKRATWAGFVAVAIYALITVFMWCQMIKQSRIASKSLQQSTESFRIDERAWIEIDPIKPTLLSRSDATFSTLFTCNIYPKNVGKTVARDIVVKAGDFGGPEEMGGNAEEMRNTQDKLLLDKFKDMGTGNPVIIPTNPVPKALAPNSMSPVPFRLTCQAPQVFPTGHQFIHYMVGRIDYCDQFQIKHWLKFCFYVVNARGEVWACKEGNDEDRNSETPAPDTVCGNPN